MVSTRTAPLLAAARLAAAVSAAAVALPAASAASMIVSSVTSRDTTIDWVKAVKELSAEEAGSAAIRTAATTSLPTCVISDQRE